MAAGRHPREIGALASDDEGLQCFRLQAVRCSIGGEQAAVYLAPTPVAYRQPAIFRPQTNGGPPMPMVRSTVPDAYPTLHNLSTVQDQTARQRAFGTRHDLRPTPHIRLGPCSNLVGRCRTFPRCAESALRLHTSRCRPACNLRQTVSDPVKNHSRSWLNHCLPATPIIRRRAPPHPWEILVANRRAVGFVQLQDEQSL